MEILDNYLIKFENITEKWESFQNEINGVQKALEISEGTLQKYYEMASQILKDQQWVDARDAFRFLVFLNPNIHSFWLGLGISEQTQGHFDQAVSAYLVAEITNPNDPIVQANLMQCYVALGNKELANRSYQIALDLCDTAEFHELKGCLMKYRRQIE